MRVPREWLRGKVSDSEVSLLSEPGKSSEMKKESDTTVRTGHIVACVLHGVNFFIVLVVSLRVPPASGVFQLTRQATVWSQPGVEETDTGMPGGFSIRHSHLDATSLNLKILIPVFVLLACTDHLFVLIAKPLNLDYLKKMPVTEQGARLRLIEYSISASLMTLAIAVEAGITDVYTLVCMFILMSTCMLCGLLADLVSQNSVDLAWCLHAIGWVTCLTAYAPIIAVFYDSVHQSSVNPPDFVYLLVWNEFVLFCGFGFIQAWYLYNLRNGNPSLRTNTELAFIAFSVVAKTFLVWIVMGPIVREQI